MKPRSCDTFVALPPATSGGRVIFGKNSDRPCSEVQEIVYVASAEHDAGTTVECTYISIPQIARTYAVILSKPSWMWGAEMGANEHGVCVGNEAVWTKLNGPEDTAERLLGMDLVRLALERARTAVEARDIIASLLETHGQGGHCSEDPDPWAYHNSFLIADPREAWVLETAGSHWAAEHITSGVRNISNQLTIGCKIDACSKGLEELAQSKGWWDTSKGPLNFALAFSSSYDDPEPSEACEPMGRQQWGRKLLMDGAKEGNFGIEDMLSILRHRPSGICMEGSFVSASSQVSALNPSGHSSHFFTGTPNPSRSLFKPFVFAPNADIGVKTASPQFGEDDPVRKTPRFRGRVDRRHELYKKHQEMAESGRLEKVAVELRQMEKHCIADTDEMLSLGEIGAQASCMFKHLVDLEMNYYR